jgi:hypothetical protein
MTKDEVMKRLQDMLWKTQSSQGEVAADCEALRVALEAVDLHDDHVGIYSLPTSRGSSDAQG